MHRFAILTVAMLGGASCIAPQASAGRDADASVAVLRGQVEEMRAALVDAQSHISAGRDADASIAGLRGQIDGLQMGLVAVRNEMHAGRDVNTNVAWTLRLLGLGVLVLGLSYPVGKMVWLAVVTLRRKAGSLGTGTGSDLSDVRDYLMMKEKCAGLVAPSGTRQISHVGESRRGQKSECPTERGTS